MKPKVEETGEPAQSVEVDANDSLHVMLEGALLTAPARPQGQELLVGEITDARHPTHFGRVRVSWRDLEGQTREKWLCTLHALAVREGDRVVLCRPANWPELVVMGVMDGFARRPEIERETKAALELQPDESVRIRSKDGQDVVEIFQADTGPVVRLLNDDVDLELPGRLRVRARAIELEATQGNARIAASADVVVQGEIVKLN